MTLAAVIKFTKTILLVVFVLVTGQRLNTRLRATQPLSFYGSTDLRIYGSIGVDMKAAVILFALCLLYKAHAEDSTARYGYFHINSTTTFHYYGQPSGPCTPCTIENRGNKPCAGVNDGRQSVYWETVQVPGVFDRDLWHNDTEFDGTETQFKAFLSPFVPCELRVDPQEASGQWQVYKFGLVNVLMALISGSIVAWRKRQLETVLYESLARRLKG